MTALYATTGLLALACALCVAAYRRKQVAGDCLFLGVGAGEPDFHSTDIAPEAQDYHAA